MIAVATQFWQANARSRGFSSMYTIEWVEKLYRGFARNLTVPFDFYCFIDVPYDFHEPIKQIPLIRRPIGYGSCIEAYSLNLPMIHVGLDTVVLGNCDDLAEYCLTATDLALPSDPYRPKRACNGVALVPAGQREIFDRWEGQNDMDWICPRKHVRIDDRFPGRVVSYKGRAKQEGVDGVSIVYFHGKEKPHELGEVGFIKECWV